MTGLLRRRQLALANPAAAGDETFRLTVDCGGSFAPGDAVPVELTVENRSDEDIVVEAEVQLEVPGRGTLTLLRGVNSLPAGSDYSNSSVVVNLPPAAPPSPSYVVLFVGSAGGESQVESCTFSVS